MQKVDVRTSKHTELVDITRQISDAVTASGHEQGMCQVFVPHTTAAVVVNERADPAVASDLARAYAAMVPNVRFDHAEGNSDAHLLASLIGPQVLLPVVDGRLRLGTWQGVFFVELDGPRQRSVWVTMLAS